MMYIDIGVNLTSKQYSFPFSIIKESFDNNTAIISIGSTIENSRKSLKICQQSQKYNPIYTTIGVHPHSANKWNSKMYHDIEQCINSDPNKIYIKALGECVV